MKRTRIYIYQTNIDSNYSAHKGYIPIPLNVKNIKSICPVLHNAEGYISLLRELDEEQILNEMRLEDDKQHINAKKVDIDISEENSDMKYILRITELFPKKIGYEFTENANGIPVKTGIYDNSCTLKIVIEYQENV